MANKLYMLISLFFLFDFAKSKIVYKTLVFNSENAWQYLTKFGISIGQGMFDIKGRFKRPYKNVPNKEYTITINFYLDTKWNSALEEPLCSNKAEYQIRVEQFSIPSDGSWSYPIVGGLRQRTRPYVWFIAASDCNESLHGSNPTLPEIELKISMTGIDDTEFSHEEIGLLSCYSICLLAYVLILSYSIYNFYKDIKRTERIDNPILIVSVAIILELLALIFRWSHYAEYYFDGEGMKFCYGLSVIFEVASQYVLSLLLILLSQGWTITYNEFGNIEIYVPITIILLILHLIIAGLTQLSNDAYHKYHDYEGFQGIVLVLLRMGMFGYFLFYMRDTYQKCKMKAKSFFKEFGYYAGGYLLSFPVLILLSGLCAHYVRNQLIQIGTVFCQSLEMCLLLSNFVGRTKYNELSKRNDAILPGGRND